MPANHQLWMKVWSTVVLTCGLLGKLECPAYDSSGLSLQIETAPGIAGLLDLIRFLITSLHTTS